MRIEQVRLSTPLLFHQEGEVHGGLQKELPAGLVKITEALCRSGWILGEAAMSVPLHASGPPPAVPPAREERISTA